MNAQNRLTNILKRGPVKVVLTERELTEQEEGRKPIEHLTVRQAVEICTQLYEDDTFGPDVYEILNDKAECDKIKITDDIKQKSSEALDFYRRNLFDRKMAGEELSDYSQALSKFVAVPDRLIRRNQAGLAITLPRFRATDIVKTTISSCRESVPEGMDVTWEKFTESHPAIIKPLDIIEERNSKRHVKTYLFTINYEEPKVRPLLTYKIPASNKQAVAAWDHIFKIGNLLHVRFTGHTEQWIGDFNSLNITDMEIFCEKKVDNQ